MGMTMIVSNQQRVAPARFLVCERTGEWASGFRRVLNEAGVRLFETRSLSDLHGELVLSPASIAAIEVKPQRIEAAVSRLIQFARDFPQARSMILADRSLMDVESQLREAGAIHVVFSRRELTSAAKLVLRHLQSIPAEVVPLEQQIWDRIPW
jgi:hypothetical protein